MYTHASGLKLTLDPDQTKICTPVSNTKQYLGSKDLYVRGTYEIEKCHRINCWMFSSGLNYIHLLELGSEAAAKNATTVQALRQESNLFSLWMEIHRFNSQKLNFFMGSIFGLNKRCKDGTYWFEMYNSCSN
jgi:hypothetical protein